MNQTSDSHPLFPTILEAIRAIVSAIEYGCKYDLPSVEVKEPTGEYLELPRQTWKNELAPAIAFFEKHELYEDCALCKQLIDKLNAEPSVEQILRQITDHYHDDTPSHNS